MDGGPVQVAQLQSQVRDIAAAPLMLGINAAVFQIVFYPKMAQWEAGGGTPLGARVCGGLSLVVWIGVIICGRTMAYQL